VSPTANADFEADLAGLDERASQGFAVLSGAKLDPKSKIVRREDGFEKRFLQRCARCKLAFAYQLDWSQYPDTEGKGQGRRTDVLYLLPGGLRNTKEMMVGGKIEE